VIFGALPRFRAAVLRRRVLTGSPPALERRLIASPEAQDKASCRLKIAYWKVDGFVSSGRSVNVRFGSKADMNRSNRDVRFTPKSGHWLAPAECLLCAKSGH
jgi:hypothetical protein